MIRIGFEDGSTLVESGEGIADIPAAIRSACSKLGVEFEQVQSVQLPNVEGCEPECSESLLAEIMQAIDEEDWKIDLAFAIEALKQYANSENWSGVSNRHQVVQRRWKGGGEGIDAAQTALDRLQRHKRYADLCR